MSSIKLATLSVFFIVFVFSLFVVIASSSLVTENCTYIKCMKNNDDVTCYCSQINSSDGQYAGDNGINSGVTDSAYVFSYQNSTQIPLGSRIDNVTVCVEWKVSNIGACQIFLNNGTNVLLSNVCHTTEALYCYDGTQHVPNASVANNLGVNVTEDYSGKLYVDWVYVNISYEKFIKNDYWNLTNYTNGFVFTDGINLTRDDIINASAHWNLTSSLSEAYVQHNGTGNMVNYSISGPYTENWTNYTLNLSDISEFPEAGLIDLKAYAVETYGWESVTTSHWFYLWGLASIDNIQLSDSLIYNGTSTRVDCKVVDSFSSGIEGYNVSFYNETSYLGSNLTNSNGWAFWHYRDNTKNPPGSCNLTCNITNQPNLFYNASSENSGSVILEVVDLIINANTSTKEVNFGGNITITANVSTDGSEPDSVWANITYINISDGKLVQGEETINLDLIDTIPPNNFIYSYEYTPPRSGQYNITVFANASRLKSNTTTFNVSFGEGSAEFIFPNFRIMDNQTFNLTINVTALYGDLFNANFTLNITDHTILNITSGETWSKSVLYNLTNGSTATLKWKCRSINEGLTRAIVTITNEDGSSAHSSEPFEVLRPLVLAEPDVVNVSQSLNMTSKIVGNVTEISHVDFSPSIPNSGCSVYSPSSVVEESECVGTGVAVGNIATAANESCNPSGDCDHVNDENNETSWIGANIGNNINLTFINPYVISEIEIVWKDLGSGSKVDILYINGTGNLKSVYNDIDVPDSKNTTVFIDFLPFQTDNIIINQTSSSTLVIYEVRLYTIEERVGKCYIYKYQFPGENLNESGIFHTNATIYTKDRTMNNFSFLINYGWPQIQIKSLSMVNGSTDTYEATVTATNGDLYDLNISLGIENKTVLNLTEGSWNLTSPVIMSGNSQTFEWNVSSLSVGSTNTSVAVNSSTGKAHYGAGFSNVNVVLSAGAPPNITDIWVDEETTQITKANLYTNAIVYVYAYDDVGLKNVILNLTYPDGITTTGSFQHDEGGRWKFIFGNNSDEIELNETGNYTIKVYAEDIGGQKKYSGEDAGCPENYTLNVTDEYTLYLMNSNLGPYMRGENITVVAEDVNGFSVDNLDWYINLTRYGESGEIFSSTGDNFTYQLTSTDPVGEYTLFAIGTKSLNTGEQTWAFNVSNTLHPFFVEPPENTQYTPSSSITPIPQVQVLNVRSEILSQTATVRLTCPNGQFYLDKVGDLYYGVSADCRASSSSGTSFYIYANAADEYNNSGSSSLQLSTTEESYNPGGGGGGGSSAKECIPTKENCTDEIDNDCDGFTDCVDPDCEKDTACIVTVKDFDFNIDKSSLEIIQGDNATVIGSLVNKGNMALTLKPAVKKECCEIYVDDEIFLPIKGEKDFVIVVHVPLFTNPGEYTFEIKTGIGSVEKSKTLNLIVKENPSISSLEEIKSRLPELKSKIENYSSGGLNVESIRQKTNQIEEKIKSAEEAVKNDNPYLFEKMVSNAQKDFNEVNSELTGLSIQKIIFENRWNILGAFIIIFVATFLVTQVILPYSKLRNEIKALEEKADIGKKTKASTEEQYFRREIDRETYMKIMTEEHDKVLEIESTIEEKKESMHKLLALSNILSNFFRFPLRISKRIKELITKNMKPKK